MGGEDFWGGAEKVPPLIRQKRGVFASGGLKSNIYLRKFYKRGSDLHRKWEKLGICCRDNLGEFAVERILGRGGAVRRGGEAGL